jgi:dTDP-4-dehydrorhamnose 3,5-epimerase-like enzyme
MCNNEIQILPRGCRIIDFPESVDDRGALSFAESTNHIPFQIERVFWIYNVPENKSRGNHSHNESSEVVVPVCGSFDMLVDDGSRRVLVHMDSSKQGILIPPGVWCELKNFVSGTVCVVFASHPYNAAGYINDYKQYINEQLEVVRFDKTLSEEWDNFIKTSKNGTFLLERNYMDYHSDRFDDCSLMFFKQGKLLALLPANWKKEESTVQSHGGLTYGGLIFSKGVTAVDALEVFSCAIDWMKTVLKADRWIYKPIPYIYSKLPSEEDLYALFRSGGKLKQRAVSSVIDCSNRLPLRQLRKRGQIKAEKAGLAVSVGNFNDDIESFWSILTDVLTGRHGKKPVHTVDEIRLLESRFPNEIKFYVVKQNDKIIAGTVVFETEQVAHAQYISASEEGKKIGALDLLFSHLITDVYNDKSYFDFGISTENGGNYLNEGLLFQKEGFGGRSVVYDTYEVRF